MGLLVVIGVQPNAPQVSPAIGCKGQKFVASIFVQQVFLVP